MSISLQKVLIKRFIDIKEEPIEGLPDSIIEEIETGRIAKGLKLQDEVFRDLSRYLNNPPQKFRFRSNLFRFHYISKDSCDINYLMYKLRDNPNILLELGYNKYLFSLEIVESQNPNDNAIYKLTITDSESKYLTMYETTVSRFD